MAVFTNRASLTYNNITTNSNIVTGEIVEVLSISKNPVGDYSQDGKVTYTISVVNSGAVPFTNLTITDNLGAFIQNGQTVVPLDYQVGSALIYVDGTVGTVTDSVVNNQLVLSGINVPANGNAVIVYEATANGFASPLPDGTITNTATLTGGGLTTPVTATAVTNATQEPVLAITKSVTPDTVTENGQLTYTLTIQNTGNTEASAGVVVSDTFDPILSGLTVTYNNAAWTQGTNYTYNQATGEFNTIDGQITVPAATYTLDPATNEYIITPGTAVIRITGTV